jgi:stage II sporulation protein D
VATALALAALLLLPGPALAAKALVIRGRGWGHGLGMSQYGAYGRALAGHGARRILRHYYTGAHVRRARLPAKVRVGLLQARRQVPVTARPGAGGGGRVVFRVAGASRRIAAAGVDAEWRVEVSATGGMRLYRNGEQIKRRGRSVFGSPRRPLKLVFAKHRARARLPDKGLSYAYGVMLFGTYPGTCDGAFCLRVVLKLPMQKYIYGLGEVPASWPHAVLAAQAIAGRTYALRRIRTSGQHREPCDCGLYDSSADQVYIGDAKRTGSGQYWWDWKRAVDVTAGDVVMYRGEPIQALYSSSSGGHTENNENVWGGAPVPYLRGVPDRFDGVASNPNYRWTKTISWSGASAKLARAFGIGRLRRITVVRPYGVSGRATVAKPAGRGGVRIVGSARTVRVDAWAVRAALDLNDTWFRFRVRRSAPSLAPPSPADQGGGSSLGLDWTPDGL